MIDHTKIRLQQNYVLIKVDKDFDKYHNEKGEETMFIAPTSFKHAVDLRSEDNFAERDIMDSYSHNMAASGTVITCPDKLVFLGNEIKEHLKANQHNLGYIDDKDAPHRSKMAAMSILNQVEKMRENSLMLQTEIDIQPGDRVFFDYLERFTIYEAGRVLQTDIGELFLIRYDKLEIRIRDGHIKPLNGFVLVEWERSKPIQFGALYLAGPDKRIEETVGVQNAEIVALPDPVNAHMDDLEFSDPVKYLKVGERVAFQSHDATPLEPDNHFILFNGREILKVQSKNILGLWQQN